MYVDTRQNSPSDINVCAFAQEDAKENSIRYLHADVRIKIINVAQGLHSKK